MFCQVHNNIGSSMTSDIQMYEDRRHIFKCYFKHKPSVTELCTLFNPVTNLVLQMEKTIQTVW